VLGGSHEVATTEGTDGEDLAARWKKEAGRSTPRWKEQCGSFSIGRRSHPPASPTQWTRGMQPLQGEGEAYFRM